MATDIQKIKITKDDLNILADMLYQASESAVLGENLYMNLDESNIKIHFEVVCEECLGTGEVPKMEQVYPNEPHVASIGTAPCPRVCPIKN